MKLKEITSKEDIIDIVSDIGFLPFFANEIAGFSIEEHIAHEYWFDGETDGAWEWKGDIASSGKCVYGKFFRGRAGFVSLDWFGDFANYRRDGYDYEGFYEDGKASYKDKDVYDAISSKGSYLSKILKSDLNYRKGGNKGFDAIITRLQMQTFVCISDFEYAVDKRGNQYGWGIARYSTPEAMFGEHFLDDAYESKPEESRKRIYDHLARLLRDANEKQILRFIG